ncbi:MAG: hypothetical protein AB1659_02725 [Thermodesulfobacteriota bacterium]
MEEDAQVESGQDAQWSDRKLCIDENCIGVIGTDGRCKECGTPFESSDKNEHLYEPAPVNDLQKPSRTSPGGEADGNPDSESDLYWEERTLCIDENCIGVIDTDGRCKECGKSCNPAGTENPE